MLSQAKFWVLLWIFWSLWIWSKGWVLDFLFSLRCHEIVVWFKTWSNIILFSVFFICKIHSTTTNTSYHHCIWNQIIHVTRWTLVGHQIIFLWFLVLISVIWFTVAFGLWFGYRFATLNGFFTRKRALHRTCNRALHWTRNCALLWTWNWVDWWRLIKILLLLIVIRTYRCSSFRISLWIFSSSYYLFTWQEMRCLCLAALLLWLLRFHTKLIGHLILLRKSSIPATARLLLLWYFIQLSCFSLFLSILILIFIFLSSVSWFLWVLPCTFKDPWWALAADSDTWVIWFLVFLSVFLLLFTLFILSEEILLLLR